jgi:hypothetical protein
MGVLYNVRVDIRVEADDTDRVGETMFRHIDDRPLRAGDLVEHNARTYIVVGDATIEPGGRCGAVVVRPAEQPVLERAPS